MPVYIAKNQLLSKTFNFHCVMPFDWINTLDYSV